MDTRTKKILLAGGTALGIVAIGLTAWLLLGSNSKKASSDSEDEETAETEKEETPFSLPTGNHCYEGTTDGGGTCRIVFNYDGNYVTQPMLIDVAKDLSIALEGTLQDKSIELTGLDSQGKGIDINLEYAKDGKSLKGTGNFPGTGEVSLTLTESGWQPATHLTAAEKLGLTGTLKQLAHSGWEWIDEYKFSRRGEITEVSSAAEACSWVFTFENGIPKTHAESEDGGETYTRSSYTYKVEDNIGRLVDTSSDGKKISEVVVTYDTAGRIVRIDDKTFTYDANGNPKDKDGKYAFMELELIKYKLDIPKEAKVKQKNSKGQPTHLRKGFQGEAISITQDFEDFEITYYD